jgi:hypothetical protein
MSGRSWDHPAMKRRFHTIKLLGQDYWMAPKPDGRPGYVVEQIRRRWIMGIDQPALPWSDPGHDIGADLLAAWNAGPLLWQFTDDERFEMAAARVEAARR